MPDFGVERRPRPEVERVGAKASDVAEQIDPTFMLEEGGVDDPRFSFDPKRSLLLQGAFLEAEELRR